MEYLEGGSLAQKLNGTPWPPKDAARLVEIVARAIDVAHCQGVVHRDLKPGNILLTADGTPKVSDFGLAKLLGDDSSLTQSDAIMGSPSYMAPEQASGHTKQAGPAADVYALGVMLYELLVGRPPFRAATALLTLEQVKSAEPVPPSRLQPGLTRDVETITLKCLQKAPERRYASAAALADDLGRFQAGEPIVARPVGAAERAWRWCWRNPRVAGSMAATAVALVAVAVVSVLYAAEQASAKKAISSLAENLQVSLTESKRLTGQLTESLAESNRRLAVLNFERADAAFANEHHELGRLWLVESWRSAAAAADPELQHAARASLSAWRRYSHEVKAVFSHDGGIICLAFSPDGKIALTGAEDKMARLWDVATGKPLGPPLAHQGAVHAVAFGPDGQTVLTGSEDNTARLWDVATGKPLGPPLAHQGVVHAVAFSPDGSAALTGSFDTTARMWSVATGKPLGPPLRHQEVIGVVTFSPDGKTVLTGSNDKTARLWDVATGKPLGPPLAHQGPVWAAAFGPDGQTVLTGSEDKTARLWDVATGEPIGPPLAHQGPVWAAAFGPDGQTVLTGSTDNTARLWDVATGQPLGPSLGHQDSVKAVAFSPDGKIALTGSFDNTARLWDVATGQPLGPPLRHRDSVQAVAFSPDGKAALTASNDTTARLWDVASGVPISLSLATPGCGPGRGVQPRRQGRTYRELRRHGAAVGRGHRQAARASPAASRLRPGRRIQPRRQDRTDRER